MRTIGYTNRISYLPATENPLSADVIFVHGDEALWIYDVGSSDEAYEAIRKEMEAYENIHIVISHFHPDHMGNLVRFFDFDDPDFPALFDTSRFHIELHVGGNTLRYTHYGSPVEEEVRKTDGCRIRIFPMPSSHAKGSLAMRIEEELPIGEDGLLKGRKKLALLGDAMYPQTKNGEFVYNAQLLKEQISIMEKELEKTPDLEVFLSHNMPPIRSGEELLAGLKCIYKERKKNSPYIAAGMPGAEEREDES